MIESRHLGAAVMLGPHGAVDRTLGAIDALIYPRSCLKLVQAIAVQRAGANLDGERLVLAAASHAGTPAHVRVVERILADAHLDASALRCPADWPADAGARREHASAGGSPLAIMMNCSGKHASFLATCVQNDWPLPSYLDPAHPLQLHIKRVVEELSGEPIVHSGVDGCGAPVHALSLTGLATAVRRVTVGSSSHEGSALASAILAHPWAIDGPGRANTVAIESLGVVAKLGAEGVMVMVAPDATTIALKILDGSPRAATLVGIELLVSVGAIDRAAATAVIAATTAQVLGGAVPVGHVHAGRALTAAVAQA